MEDLPAHATEPEDFAEQNCTLKSQEETQARSYGGKKLREGAGERKERKE